MNRRDALLILNAIEGLGPKRILKLTGHYGSPEAVIREGLSGCRPDWLPQAVKTQWQSFRQDEFLRQEYCLIAQQGVRVITYFDEDYPVLLKEIAAPPVVLYKLGDRPLADTARLGIVGARKASLYGTTVARKFAARFADYGIPVVSGLARGIDTAAHKGTVDAGGQTIAVLGSGLNCIYPGENRGLCRDIVRHGAVLSEFPMNVAPLPFNFPRRNRIISGLSAGVLVVEAALKSGALITADCALEQGREVYAVPGKIDSPTSRGVHELIKQGARIVTGPEDIIADLDITFQDSLRNETAMPLPVDEATEDSLSREAFSLYRQLSDKPVHINELNQELGLSSAQTASLLLDMEFKKIIKQLPGKMFVRTSTQAGGGIN